MKTERQILHRLKHLEAQMRRMLVDIDKHGWGTWASFGWDEKAQERRILYEVLGKDKPRCACDELTRWA